MTTLELQNKKVELAKQILSSDNEDLINRLSNIYNKLTTLTKFPCDYTEEEVLMACETTIKEMEAGTLVPSSMIKRKIS